MTRVALVVTAVLAAAPALAQTKVEEARQHFKRGTELYDEGNYRGALVEFQRAYELSPNYKLLYNMGQVYLELQDYAKAGRNLNRYLTEGGNEVPAARRDEVTKQLERLKNRVGQISVDTSPGAEILIDDESQGFAPLPEALTVSIGRHKVTVIIPGSTPQSRVVDVAGLQTLTVAFTAGGDSGGNAVGIGGRAPQAGKTRPLVIGLWVGTGVLAITAAVMGFVAFGASNTLKEQKSHIQSSPEALSAQAGAVFGDSVAADILTALAVVAGVSALVVTLTGGSDAAPRVSVGLGPHGFALTGKF